jgi:hypothetical protein
MASTPHRSIGQAPPAATTASRRAQAPAAPAATKTDRALEDKMLAFAGDPERVEALRKTRDFKRSWLELAEALTQLREREAWRRWGHVSFEEYCRRELHLKPTTAAKLVGSYAFLRSNEPRVIERTRSDDLRAPVPSLQAVDFVARAAERGAADSTTMREIRRAAFDEGAEAPLLSRRYREVAFPVDEGERGDRLRSQLVSTARRLASLIAEPDAPLPRGVATAVEESLGQLLGALDA